ncbi:MAG: leucine-rich repeat domain-containing protein, partial [Spirochaetales bacterium]|nr:leucine-rich repeat domain-containing protein [Spirochaetales bacterium]
LRVIETKKAALVEIRKNVKAEQTAIAKSYEKECSAKIDAINNTPWRTAELSKGEPTKEAKQRREAQIHDLQTEYKNRILTEQERIENATEESQYEVYNEISADWKTLGEKTFYANTVSGNLRITIGEYDGNKKSWDMKYSILSDGLELHTGSSEIKYSDLETLKPSGMDFYDAVDMYDSLFRCNEPVLTFEISYKITPIKERISTYEYEFYGLKVFDTTSVTRTQSMALSGSSFVCKDTISKHSKQMSPGYDIGTELEKGYTISNGGTSLTIRSNDGFEAFKNDKNYSYSKLTSVIIGNGITSIGNYAFSDCSSLTSITIPNGVTSIGSNAFQNCSSLTSITIPDSVTSIDNSAFSGCSRLTSITIPSNVIFIRDFVFYGCSSLTTVTIPNGITSIDNSAFSGCSRLTNVIIPNGVTSIGDRAFQGCSSLTSITIPNGVTSIGSNAFQNCSSLISITIPNGVTSIGNWAFQSCSSLTSITIPNSITSIGDYAFNYCSSLTSITIPNGVTSIGNYAFSGC